MDFDSLTVKNRLWIVSEQGTFLGEGRIALLQAIEKYGSISAAARSMNMSYLKAWKLIDSMNNVSADQPLVIKTSGGKDGGGTILTAAGKKAIAIYMKLNTSSQIFLNTELNRVMVQVDQETISRQEQ